MRGEVGATKLPLVELVSVVVAGALHVTTELATSLSVSRAYNGTACVVFLGYVVWRVRQDPSVLRTWGFRTDNLRQAGWAYAAFVGIGVAAIWGASMLLGEEQRLSASSLALYVGWGLAQQFALQNLLARNLATLVGRTWPSALLASVLFAASHIPRLELSGIACAGGVVFVVLYRRVPNLYTAGAAHGVLGWMAFGCLGLE
ncbi:MAG: hypothetical protein GY711_16920 [bacterium]|nr:hypothetical protein [bacterium]